MAFEIPFNKPPVLGNEIETLQKALSGPDLSGEGVFSKEVCQWLKSHFSCAGVVLTPSCTSALEMATLLADIKPGDEVIMPSFTFPSTANAVVLRGATPVFADINPSTLNMSPTAVEPLISEKTKALMPVHYAGISEPTEIMRDLADSNEIYMIEDAAQCMGAKYRDKPIGTAGHFSAISFHSTKNVVCGEGGALIVNDEKYWARAEVIRDKGTNRTDFKRGNVSKYQWQDIGSSFLMSELQAAFLTTQLKSLDTITSQRKKLYHLYQKEMQELVDNEALRTLSIPEACETNGHIFALITRSPEEREKLRIYLVENGIQATSHFEPLHLSNAGRRFGKAPKSLTVTEAIAPCVLRLPLHYHLTEDEALRVCETVREFYI